MGIVLMVKYETTILCPDSKAGEEALHELMSEGWECFCSWLEREWNDGQCFYTNHIAMRRVLDRQKS